MFPSSFDYVAAHSVDEAVAAKREGGDEARFLAGGQSLMPMMKIRLATPAKLVDINGIPGLDTLERVNGHLRVGALVRHADVAALRPHVRRGRARPRRGSPIRWCATAARSAARSPTAIPRATGTRCCSPPAPTWSPAAPNGERAIPITEFVVDFFTNALADDEMVTEVRIPVPPGRAGGSYQKLERKVGDYATVAVAAHLELGGDGTIARAGLALTAVEPGEHQGHRGRGSCSSASSRATSCSPRPASSPRRRREPRDDVRGIGRVEAQRRARVHPSRAAPRPRDERRRTSARARSGTVEVTVTINGTDHTHDVEPRMLLVDFIRTQAGLTGTHIGCDTTSCGACTVLLDGTPMKSCTMLAVQADGRVAHHRRGAQHDGVPGIRCRPRSRRSTACSAGSARRG